MMQKASEDLFEQYQNNPKEFKKTHTGMNTGQKAIEMLESVIADAAQKMVDMENTQSLVLSQVFDLLEQEHLAESRVAEEEAVEGAAKDQMFYIEEINDDYEVEERRRDMSVSHAAHELFEAEKEVAEKQSQEKEK
eukprot:788438_1